MSTRSYILKENDDGTYIGIYCHNDGYLSYNGAMLIDHYKNREKVEKLISLGNMSSLNIYLDPDPSKEHSFDDRQEDVSVFYQRDRGEEGQEACNITLEELNDPSSWIEYCYIYTKDNKWSYFKCGELDKGLKDLEEGLNEEYKNLGFNRPEGYYGFYTEDDIKHRIYEEEVKSKEM